MLCKINLIIFIKHRVGSDNVEEIIPETPPPKINGHSAFEVENGVNGNGNFCKYFHKNASSKLINFF